MVEGEFRLPEPFSSSANPYQHRDRIRHKLADIYIVNVDVEIKAYVAIKPGNKVIYQQNQNQNITRKIVRKNKYAEQLP